MKAFWMRASSYLGSMVENLRTQRSTLKEGYDPLLVDLSLPHLETGCQEYRTSLRDNPSTIGVP